MAGHSLLLYSNAYQCATIDRPGHIIMSSSPSNSWGSAYFTGLNVYYSTAAAAASGGIPSRWSNLLRTAVPAQSAWLHSDLGTGLISAITETGPFSIWNPKEWSSTVVSMCFNWNRFLLRWVIFWEMTHLSHLVPLADPNLNQPAEGPNALKFERFKRQNATSSSSLAWVSNSTKLECFLSFLSSFSEIRLRSRDSCYSSNFHRHHSSTAAVAMLLLTIIGNIFTYVVWPDWDWRMGHIQQHQRRPLSMEFGGVCKVKQQHPLLLYFLALTLTQQNGVTEYSVEGVSNSGLPLKKSSDWMSPIH